MAASGPLKGTSSATRYSVDWGSPKAMSTSGRAPAGLPPGSGTGAGS